MKEFKEILPGVNLRNAAIGEKTHMVEFRLQAGCVIPDHSHANEQTGYLVSGKLSMTIGGEARTLLPGATWCIAENVVHGVEVIEESTVIEVFSPPRKDYIDG